MCGKQLYLSLPPDTVPLPTCQRQAVLTTQPCLVHPPLHSPTTALKSSLAPGSVPSYSSLLLGLLFIAPRLALQWSRAHADEDDAILST